MDVLERVDVGHQVAANAVGVDHFLNASSLRAVVAVVLRKVADPLDRLVRDAQVGEDFFVETALAEQ